LEEEHKDLVVSEDKEDLICYTKPLFRLKMCLTEKEWSLICKKMWIVLIVMVLDVFLEHQKQNVRIVMVKDK
jgi:hypothetical protein